MKTILVPTEHNASMVSALDTALLLAQKFGSCIEGFPLRPAVADLVAMDPDSGLTMVAVKENDAEMVRQADDLFRSFMTQHQVPLKSGTARHRHRSLARFRPSGHDFVGSYGRVFDVIVLARPGDEWQSPSMVTLGIGSVRERPAGADRAAEFAALAGHQCADRVESQHRAGAHHGRRHAAFAPRRAHHHLHRRGRHRCRAERRADGALAEAQRHQCRADHAQAGRQAQRRRDAARQGRRARLRPHHQGRLYAKPPAPDDFRRHHAAHSRQGSIPVRWRIERAPSSANLCTPNE